jgi:two-component system sensor histidine kinase KdpD
LGFETVPQVELAYQGRTLEELDIDAVLTRHPQLVLVDELAHTNAPGSRHDKRYQDVEELLAAGIDVYSTLNIQHLESLNDVVASFTKVRVRETLPTACSKRRDRDRRHPARRADRAAQGGQGLRAPRSQPGAGQFLLEVEPHALRELRAATRGAGGRRPDARLCAAHALPAAGRRRRLVVAVSEQPGAPRLVRQPSAWRSAAGAVDGGHIETAAERRPSAMRRMRNSPKTMHLCQQLGAQVATVPPRT